MEKAGEQGRGGARIRKMFRGKERKEQLNKIQKVGRAQKSTKSKM